LAKYLIVNADDYGRTPGVSQGIRQAHQEGIVTSTTAMLNMPGVEAALRQAQEECPALGLGVHLTLTSGAPVLPAGQVTSLTGGAARFPGLDEQMPRLEALKMDEIQAEWRAQIERFMAVVGHAPDHLDSHHHFSYLSPALLESLLILAQEYACPIRLPLRRLDERQANGLPEELLPHIAAFAPALLAARPVRCPDYFSAEFYAETATLAQLRQIINRLPLGVTELMCHPGYADAALLAGSSYNQQRQHELALLTDPSLALELARLDIERITFARL